MILTAFIHCVDPSLGRLDHASLSDQALMELLFGRMYRDKLKKFQDEHGEFLDIAEWPGVTCKDDTVDRIDFSQNEIEGFFDFANIPRNVTYFRISSSERSLCKAEGKLDVKDLPRGLTAFLIPFNIFTGGVETKDLPQGLTLLDIGGNLLLSGTFAFEALPKDLQQCSIMFNKFSGSVRLDELPAKLERLFINNNKFSGCFELLKPPATLVELDAAHNAFSGTAVVTLRTRANVYLNKNELIAIVDERKKKHPQTMRMHIGRSYDPFMDDLYDGPGEDPEDYYPF